MTSQANSPNTGEPRIVLTEEGPRIDAIDTIRIVWREFAVHGAYQLVDLLEPGSAWLIAAAEPANGATGEPVLAIFDDPEWSAAAAVRRVAATATAAGCSTTVQQLWADRIGETFVSEPRLIEVLRVQSTWRFTTVRTLDSEDRSSRTHGNVTVGSYLIISTGLDPMVKAACRIERTLSSNDLVAVAGFSADRIRAECSRCHRSWTASNGRYDFAPADDTNPAWRLDDHTELGLVTATAPCPVRDCTGRIGFSAGRA